MTPMGSGFAMRQPNRNKRRLRSLPSDLKHINVRVFAVGMEKLADYLEGLDNWFGDLVEAKIEYQVQQGSRGQVAGLEAPEREPSDRRVR